MEWVEDGETRSVTLDQDLGLKGWEHKEGLEHKKGCSTLSIAIVIIIVVYLLWSAL